MTQLDHDWLYQALRDCAPGLPEPLDPAALMEPMQPEDLSVLEAFYGTGTRLDRAREVFRVVKARAQQLACGVDFAGIWRALICAEWLAHSRLEDHIEQKLYRDHIFHPAAVAMLGWKLLEAYPDMRTAAASTLEGRLADDYVLDPSLNQTWEAVLDHAWLVAGFFHDHCCPYETLAKCDEAIRKHNSFLDGDVLKPFRQKAHTLWKGGYVAKDTKNFLRRHMKKAKHSHAALSALALFALKPGAPNDFAQAVLDVAADAVLWHHETGEDYDWKQAGSFEFAEHPLRYLLVLCDGLHEFCREFLIRSEINDGEFRTCFCESYTHAELATPGSNLHIEYHVNCNEQVCGSRWKLSPSSGGLRKLQAFLNRCGPLSVRCNLHHADCATCVAGSHTACSCAPHLCNHG